jgi:hypothetical protein
MAKNKKPEDLCRLKASELFQAALEVEVDEALERLRYERRSGAGKTGFTGARWQAASTAASSSARLVDVFDIDLFPRNPLRKRRRHERIERTVEHI